MGFLSCVCFLIWFCAFGVDDHFCPKARFVLCLRPCYSHSVPFAATREAEVGRKGEERSRIQLLLQCCTSTGPTAGFGIFLRKRYPHCFFCCCRRPHNSLVDGETTPSNNFVRMNRDTTAIAAAAAVNHRSNYATEQHLETMREVNV